MKGSIRQSDVKRPNIGSNITNPSTSEKKKNKKNILQLKTKISSAADKVVYYVMN